MTISCSRNYEAAAPLLYCDYDNDGWLDIFLVQRLAPSKAFAPKVRVTRFPAFSKQQRDGHIHRCHSLAGVAHSGWGQGCCVGGLRQRRLRRSLRQLLRPKTSLYTTTGSGTMFTDVSEKSRARRWRRQALEHSGLRLFVDYDRDGKLVSLRPSPII